MAAASEVPAGHGAAADVGARTSALTAWASAGLGGGALAGFADAVVVVARGVGGLSVVKAARLIILDASCVAIVGLIAALLIGVAAVLRNERLRSGAASAWRRAPELGLALI